MLRPLITESKGEVDSLKSLFSRIVAAASIQASQMGLQLATAILLAHSLGAKRFGEYAFAMSVVTVVSLPATMGIRNVATRFTALYADSGRWALLAGLWRWLTVRALSWGAGGAACLLLSILILGLLAIPIGAFKWGIGVLVVSLVLIYLCAVLRGLSKITAGQVPEFLFRPAVFLLLLLLAFEHFDVRAEAETVMAFQLIATAMAMGLAVIFLYRFRPPQVVKVPPEVDTEAWQRPMRPLAYLGAMTVVTSQADLLILGLLGGVGEVGIYRVAVQAAALVEVSLVVVGLILAPRVSSLYSQGRAGELQGLLTKAARLSLIAAVPLSMMFVGFGGSILAFAFGEEFIPGYYPLVILVAAQLLNVLAGNVGTVLNMTGNERDTALGFTVAAVTNVGLSLLLVPFLGAIGAAVSSATSIVVWNVILSIALFRRTGLHCTAIGFQRGTY